MTASRPAARILALAACILPLAAAALAAGASSPELCPSGSCAAPIADLAPPITRCQSETADLTCALAPTYTVTLVQGQTYTFTSCGSTCTGAGAAFDSRLELYQGGVLVASSDNACGNDGEVVYTTDPLTGGGSYCVRLVPQASIGSYTLGYRVSCQPPSAVVVTPDRAGTTGPGCAHRQTFTVNTAGTGEFTYDWTIVPAAGNSATPSTRRTTRIEGSDTFTTDLAGIGGYAVSVTVTNDCGSVTETIAYQLEDRAAPDITCSAQPAGCSPLGPGAGTAAGGRPASEIASALAASRGEIGAMLLAAPTPAEAERAIARKLALLPEQVHVFEGSDPRFRRGPGSEALSCPAPCTFGTLQAAHPFYEVFVNCDSGAYTASTGASHSVTALGGGPQNVIFGGAGGVPGTSEVTLFVHNSGAEFLNPSGGEACAFDPPDTAAEPNSLGLEVEWTLDAGAPGLQPLRFREELVAFGTTEPDSGIRLTLGAHNPPGSTATAEIGFRWQIDYQNAFDDGPGFATVTCDPFQIGPQRFTEHELLPSEVLDFYRIQNNTGTPIFDNFTSTAPIAGFPDTATPDRLVYGAWPSMVGSPWDYVAFEGDDADSDSATLVYYGYTRANALQVPPGASVTRSVVIFTSANTQSCGGFRPGQSASATVEICPGECAELSASAADNCTAAPAIQVLAQTAGAPACSGNPCTLAFPDPGDFDYEWEATDGSGNSTRCTTRVRVFPEPGAALAPLAPVCAGQALTLDAGATSANGCSQPLEYRFLAGSTVLRDWAAGASLGPVVPAASTTYTVEARCPDRASCVTAATRAVDVVPQPVARAGADASVCEGVPVTLDGSASSATACPGGVLYEGRRGTTVVRPASPLPSWQPPTGTPGTTLYTLVVSCAAPPGCAAGDDVEVEVRSCPMAVRFDAFDAVRSGPLVAVRWRTLSEEDTSWFQVERAAGPDGPWVAAGFHDAHGPFLDYAVEDRDAPGGALPWYRIVEQTSAGRGDETPAFQARDEPRAARRAGTGGRTRGVEPATSGR